MLNAISVSKKLAQLSEEDNIRDLSPLKLQKILYFVEGCLLSSESRAITMYPETPQAWKYGPVYVDVYERFKDKIYGASIISSDFDDSLEISFDNFVEECIKKTWDKYKNKSAGELITLTHRTNPWIIAVKYGYGSRISKQDMLEYFTVHNDE